MDKPGRVTWNMGVQFCPRHGAYPAPEGDCPACLYGEENWIHPNKPNANAPNQAGRTEEAPERTYGTGKRWV